MFLNLCGLIFYPPSFGRCVSAWGTLGGVECLPPTSAPQARLFPVPCLTLPIPSTPGIIFQVNYQHQSSCLRLCFWENPNKVRKRFKWQGKTMNWAECKTAEFCRVVWGSKDRRMSTEYSREWNSLSHVFKKKKKCIEHLVCTITDRVFLSPWHLQSICNQQANQHAKSCQGVITSLRTKKSG